HRSAGERELRGGAVGQQRAGQQQHPGASEQAGGERVLFGSRDVGGDQAGQEQQQRRRAGRVRRDLFGEDRAREQRQCRQERGDQRPAAEARRYLQPHHGGAGPGDGGVLTVQVYSSQEPV